MNYNSDFFEEQVLTHTDCIYGKVIMTPFYAVYVSDDGRYHIAKEEYESIRERMYFYQNDIVKEEKYPVYLKNIGLWMEGRNSEERVLQVLSLPREICFEKQNGNEVLRSFDDILSMLSFEEGLNETKEVLRISKEDIKSNAPFMNMAINYLMANGFYLMNIEKIVDPSPRVDDDDYPFYIHEDKIPIDLRAMKETSHKLIMDFVDDPFLVTRAAYKKYYAKLDSMSLEEKAAYAFCKVNPMDIDRVELNLKMALRRYFYALARIVLGRFFTERFGPQSGLGHTVLDHDFQADQMKYRMVYLGTHHDMYAKSYRTFVLEDDEVKEINLPRDYVLDVSEKAKLAHAFDITQQYFKRHSEYAFLPSVFLKILGLPYPAFERARYFDFENGDARSFLSLFSFEHGVNYEHVGLLLPIARTDGSTMERDDSDYAVPFLLRKMEEDHFFLSDFSCIVTGSDNDFLFHFSSKKEIKYASVVQGKSSLFEESLSKMEDYAAKNNPMFQGHPYLSLVRKFILQQEKGGILLPVRDYFSFLNEGYSSRESIAKVYENYPSVDIAALRFLVCLGTDVTLSKKAEDHVSGISYRSDRYFSYCHEVFYDPYLKYPIVHKGRFFYIYEDEDGSFHMEKRDLEALKELQKIYKKHFPASEAFPFPVHYMGEELMCFALPKDSTEFRFLGLPDVFSQNEHPKTLKECLKHISFEEGISLYDEPRHFKMLSEDESLSSLFVFQEGFRNDVYLTLKSSLECPTYILTAHNQRDYMQYLDYDFLAMEMDGKLGPSLPDGKKNSYYHIYKMEFKNALLSCIIDGSTTFEDDEMDVPLSFAGQMLCALYHVYDQKLFRRKEVVSYISSFEYQGVYVSPGSSFYAFCDTKDGKFGILKEHVDDFYALFEILRSKTIHIYDLKIRCRDVVYRLGVPVAMRKPFYEYLFERKMDLKKEDIPVYEGKLPFLEDELPDFVNLFSVEKQNYTGLYDKSKNRRRLLSQGFYIYPNTNFFDEKYNEIESFFGNSGAAMFSLLQQECSVFKEPTGIVKETMLPNEATMHVYIKSFLKKYDNSTAFSKDNLMMVMAFLIYTYHTDDGFFIRFINTYQGHQGNLSDTFFDSMVAGFHKHYPMNGRQDGFILLTFTILFSLYLERKMMVYQIARS